MWRKMLAHSIVGTALEQLPTSQGHIWFVQAGRREKPVRIQKRNEGDDDTTALSLGGRRHGALSRRNDRVGFEGNGKTCIVHIGQEPAPDVIQKSDTNRLVQGSDVRRDRRGHELPRQKSFKRRN